MSKMHIFMAACAEEHDQESGHQSRQQSSAISWGLVEVFNILKGITDINKYLLSKCVSRH